MSQKCDALINSSESSYGATSKEAGGEEGAEEEKRRWSAISAISKGSKCSKDSRRASESSSMSPGSESDDMDLEKARELYPSLAHRRGGVSEVPSLVDTAAPLHPAMQVLIYILAVALLIIVFLVPSPLFDSSGQGHHARNDEQKHMVMRNICYGVLAAGACSWVMHMIKLPLFLGYLLGGVIVGPIGLQLIIDEREIATMTELGLIFLLFMIGLELDIEELSHLGSKVFLTGLVQFPICVCSHLAVFALIGFYGIEIGGDSLSPLYIAVCCGLSSTMIVVKSLQDKQETTTQAGKISVGILIIQDMWAIVVLAIQPNLEDPKFFGILKTFFTMAGLVIVSFGYAKYVMPRLLASVSRATEMMLVLSLSWCFFVCVTAIMPFVNLSMELAALIAGASLATFPYSKELNTKIRYLRDFFLTLYFVTLGMQIPVPTASVLGAAVWVAGMVVVVRWAGVFGPIYFLGGGGRAASIATLNLSQVSEFALVICALGHQRGHIQKETLTILIWVFLIMAVFSCKLIEASSEVYNFLYFLVAPYHWPKEVIEDNQEAQDGDEHHEVQINRDILALGLFAVGNECIDILQKQQSPILKRMHVIDLNTEQAQGLLEKGISASYGDFSSKELLSNTIQEPRVVLSLIPDTILRGVTNQRLCEICMQIWPKTQFIGTAEDDRSTKALYAAGATYVILPVKFSAEAVTGILLAAKDPANLTEALVKIKGVDNPYTQKLQLQV